MTFPKKIVVVLAIIFSLTAIAYAIKNMNTANTSVAAGARASAKANELPLPQANTRPNPATLPTIPSMPAAANKGNAVEYYPEANYPDLDRLPLARENNALLPANESLQTNYKDWDNANADNELYAKGNPLFNQQNKAALAPPDINSNQRRINFY